MREGGRICGTLRYFDYITVFISLKGYIAADVSDIHLSKQVHHMHFIVGFTDTRLYCTGSKVYENRADF